MNNISRLYLNDLSCMYHDSDINFYDIIMILLLKIRVL